MPAQFHQAHGLLQAQALDAFANMLFGNKLLRGFRINLGSQHGLGADYSGFTHGDLPVSNI
jgi:hypothetical protein